MTKVLAVARFSTSADDESACTAPSSMTVSIVVPDDSGNSSCARILLAGRLD